MHFLLRILVLELAAVTLIGAGAELYQIARGTGIWIGQFAPTWFAAFLAFAVFAVVLLMALAVTLWRPQTSDRWFAILRSFRMQIGVLRWVFIPILLFLPVYFLQYAFWGLVLHGMYLRILLAALSVIGIAWSLSKADAYFVDPSALWLSLVSVAGILSLFASLARVTDYPFSLGWSEGNRLWDYSVLFGRNLYLYPADKEIPVFLETSRQFIGGIPFLIPGLKIEQARLWLALVDVVPYLVLGWIAFRFRGTRTLPWILAGVWAFTFVRQGPIHPPLMICAIAVALAWQRPLWIAVPLIFVTGYYAEASRFTWLFAPAMWSVMLEFAGAHEVDRNVWRRSVAVGIAGILGGYVAPFYLPAIVKINGEAATGGLSISTVSTGLSSQPLLWDRLLPNATYGTGILLGLLLAVGPLIVILGYWVRAGQWQLKKIQMVSIVLPLLAFLLVGLIVSVKIGGGGDLHNLDMFIIGLMFAAAIAWKNAGYEWLRQHGTVPWVRIVLIVALAVPAFRPLLEMQPLSVSVDLKKVATLADITTDPLPNPLPDTIPAKDDSQKALQKIKDAVLSSRSSGDILFMDQRQLLTFGYIQDVPLVPEYDKKLLIDMAMADNAAYFAPFYDDLASHRFSLIVTSPVNRRLDTEDGHFGDENNAWVKWVTKPLLCYYEPLDLLKKVDVQLLVPRTGTLDCTSELPR